MAMPLTHSFLPSLSFSPSPSSLPLFSFHRSTHSSPPKLLYTSKIKCASTDKQDSQSKTTSSLDPKRGVAVYKPKSYEVLVTDAANSLALALQDGKTRLEIDFPPLPSDVSSYKGSSDDFNDANVQLALAVVRKLKEKTEARVCIVFPDNPEKRRASELFKAAIDGVTF